MTEGIMLTKEEGLRVEGGIDGGSSWKQKGDICVGAPQKSLYGGGQD